jgi:hypothetical protein
MASKKNPEAPQKTETSVSPVASNPVVGNSPPKPAAPAPSTDKNKKSVKKDEKKNDADALKADKAQTPTPKSGNAMVDFAAEMQDMVDGVNAKITDKIKGKIFGNKPKEGEEKTAESKEEATPTKPTTAMSPAPNTQVEPEAALKSAPTPSIPAPVSSSPALSEDKDDQPRPNSP